jgi:hypothetical protein
MHQEFDSRVIYLMKEIFIGRNYCLGAKYEKP